MIIAITGRKRSGKDTIADYLISKHNFSRYGFADPIREISKVIFGWTEDWIVNNKETIDPYWGISYRQFAQDVGTEYMQYGLGSRFPEFLKTNGRSVWVKRFLKIYEDEKVKSNWVLSDCRFPHETIPIRKHGGIVIRVIRPDKEDTSDLHASEIEQENIIPDYTLINNAGIKDLERAVFEITIKEYSKSPEGKQYAEALQKKFKW